MYDRLLLSDANRCFTSVEFFLLFVNNVLWLGLQFVALLAGDVGCGLVICFVILLL